MSTAVQELVRVCEALPPERQSEVVDFARFLHQQADDTAWERIIADKRPRPKLDKFVADALREGKSEPLDTNKL